jgi:DNA-nicking Smr family endonuclease
MKHGSGDRPEKPSSRQITQDEAELWHRLAHSLDKVKTKPRVAIHQHGTDATVPASASPARQPARGRRAPSVPSPPKATPPPPVQAARPAELDRRTLRQVASGRVSIDATLDLHGLHQNAAHARLRAFLVSSQAKGHRMVLVITGKGGGVRSLAPQPRSDRERDGEQSNPSARGVLRRSVPQWLEESEFRAVVLSYAAAGVRHGGDGALYIRLRKARDG